MNQRLSRHLKKNNNLDFISLSTGGQTARHIPNEAPQLQMPQKATGDIKPEEKPKAGTAKASPNFKPIPPPVKPLSQEDEKKVIASNSEPVKDEKDDE